ncbi:hypothetical protein BpHYR1_021480 [Brachionus plicatilis]|uniref:Uncharacterized protein n=1 Tax=Brachionus plicatilis TaxID=10195 RepID=A0A3M7QBW5_BRAPC|nr:hypothetical protein BpHYR1_021480 [Brachionus plicatilis]
MRSQIKYFLMACILLQNAETDVFYFSFEKKISPTCKLHHGPAGSSIIGVNFDILDDQTSKR